MLRLSLTKYFPEITNRKNNNVNRNIVSNRTFGAPLTVPTGNAARKASQQVR